MTTTSGSIVDPGGDPALMIIFTGESNSGGYAENGDASGPELASREEVQILNNTTFEFENLDIGTNNLIDHFGLPANETHGWELGLGNAVEDGDFDPLTKVYLVKTGQGGSRIGDWEVGGTYWDKMEERYNAAVALMDEQGLDYPKVIWYSQGINDQNASMSAADWKAATITHLENLRDLMGADTPILMTELPNPSFSGYNAKIDEIVSEVANTYKIDTTGASMRDSFHWDYEGMKLIASRFVTETLVLI